MDACSRYEQHLGGLAPRDPRGLPGDLSRGGGGVPQRRASDPPGLARIPIGSSRDAPPGDVDLGDVRGQAHAQAARWRSRPLGGHHLLLIGPPGTGRRLLARRLPTILPSLTLGEAIEASRVWSVAGLSAAGGARDPSAVPGAPSHACRPAGLVGGGRLPHPGEVSLAHLGVLFLDELPEFGPYVLDTLRQPLEDGSVTHRAGRRVRCGCRRRCSWSGR